MHSRRTRVVATPENTVDENPDVTCQELREFLTRKGIRMGNKSVNTIRRELGQQRPSY
jgi:uncharacterized protein YneF (UPF0154 family)